MAQTDNSKQSEVVTSQRQLFHNVNRRVSFDCFWQSGCSDSVRCNANGTCVAAAQAGGATFPQQMEPDSRPLSHMEILSAVAHHASEIARLTAAIPVQCKPDETSDVTYTKSDVEALLAIALAAKAKVSHDACKHPRAWRTQAVCGICLKEVGEI